MQKKLTITSDIIRTLKNAPYKEPSKAIRELVDNCLIGLKLKKAKREVEINYYLETEDSLIPDRIQIVDNGIGMTNKTKEEAYYTVQEVDGKTEHGGTSTHGIGANQAAEYLGDFGPVVSSTGDEASQSQITYPKGESPTINYTDEFTQSDFEKFHKLFKDGHGTSVEIINIDKSKWDNNWWATTSAQRYNRLLARIYRLLLKDETLSITVKRHNYDGSINSKLIEPAIVPLDNGLHDSTATINYLDSKRNGFTSTGVVRQLETINTSITLNIGKTLAPSEKDCWKTMGKDNLFESTPASFANPGVVMYQNKIEVADHKLKKSDREVGLMHLNGLFVEVHFPNDIKLPTTTTKTDIQETLKNEIIEIVIEEAEKIWPPNDEHDEFAWHKQFKKDVTADTLLGQALRDKYFGGISAEEAKEQIKHEYQLGGDRPDFSWVIKTKTSDGDDVSITKRIFELKPIESKSEDLAQLSKYWMTYPHTEGIHLLAQSHSTNVQNTLPEWNENRKANFHMETYSELGIKLS